MMMSKFTVRLCLSPQQSYNTITNNSNKTSSSKDWSRVYRYSSVLVITPAKICQNTEHAVIFGWGETGCHEHLPVVQLEVFNIVVRGQANYMFGCSITGTKFDTVPAPCAAWEREREREKERERFLPSNFKISKIKFCSMSLYGRRVRAITRRSKHTMTQMVTRLLYVSKSR